jgi:hypothetical protein
MRGCEVDMEREMSWSYRRRISGGSIVYICRIRAVAALLGVLG